ncbi:MAG: dephospho-CoA kinase [Clostridia bacterium]|nr:dephospho-CoA kinase [Clostridia bacterium]
MRIAIIGGIGSGKSEVLKIARQMGVAALSADEINAELLALPEYIAEIARVFPAAVVNGTVDRHRLAEIVFANDNEREKLNTIAHPRILARIKDDNRSPLVVEMPLLLECGAQGMFDEIVLVRTPLDTRLERLEKRGLDKESAIKRINAQASEDELMTVATRVIDNSGDIETLCKNAKLLFNELLKGYR